MIQRSSGILLPIFSLPSPYGIGTLGKEAYAFVDFLAAAGQSYWQILPVCPTSYGDSPYQSFSTFAGNPYFIDLDILRDEGLLQTEDYANLDWGESDTAVDYGLLYKTRFRVLQTAFRSWIGANRQTLTHYFAENPWVESYALFMALKDAHKGAPWWEWGDAYRVGADAVLAAFSQQNQGKIGFWGFVQYTFAKQWGALKQYANGKGIRILGDLPIYVARDSADVWANPENFWLDENLDPIRVAGCPPDAFSATGQLWGNPIYDWERMQQDGYSWWCSRIQAATQVYDTVRIDHFRGFDSYYAIPYGDETAAFGQWMKGPGISFFQTVEDKLGKLDIIAEDLGFLTPSVHKLLKDSGYPGMKVLEFAFDPREESCYLPHTYSPNCVVYIGTHDNDTALGWLKTIDRASADYCKRYLRLRKREGYHWGMIAGAWASPANLAIAQMQDVLGLGSEARINIPSTVGENWKWRMRREDLNPRLALKLRRITKLYSRLAKPDVQQKQSLAAADRKQQRAAGQNVSGGDTQQASKPQ